MIVYPNAKINLGLNILRKRDDGYHDISSIFYPVKECVDILEIIKSDTFEFTKSGIEIPDGENLCTKAWKLLHTDFGIGNVNIHLHKQIAIGAGLGGGSADGSFTLKSLNELFDLNLNNINGRPMSSGMVFVRVESGNEQLVKKFIILKK